jgi:hypothetical protein
LKKYSGRGKDGHPKRSPSHRSSSHTPAAIRSKMLDAFIFQYKFERGVQLLRIYDFRCCHGDATHPTPRSWCSPIPSLDFRTRLSYARHNSLPLRTNIQLSSPSSSSSSREFLFTKIQNQKPMYTTLDICFWSLAESYSKMMTTATMHLCLFLIPDRTDGPFHLLFVC